MNPASGKITVRQQPCHEIRQKSRRHTGRRIKIDEAAGVHLTATDGDVELGRVDGPAEISTARGDIRITDATHGTVVPRTQQGDISISAAAGVSATLDAGTSYGRITNTLKNDGSPELDIHATAQGDIDARSL